MSNNNSQKPTLNLNFLLKNLYKRGNKYIQKFFESENKKKPKPSFTFPTSSASAPAAGDPAARARVGVGRSSGAAVVVRRAAPGARDGVPPQRAVADVAARRQDAPVRLRVHRQLLLLLPPPPLPPAAGEALGERAPALAGGVRHDGGREVEGRGRRRGRAGGQGQAGGGEEEAAEEAAGAAGGRLGHGVSVG